MGLREEYTSEGFKSHYSSAFELCNKAIVYARYSLKSGHYMSLEQILDEMRKDPKLVQHDIETLETKLKTQVDDEEKE